MTAFICMLWKMCSKEFGSVQYSLLWSLYLFKADFFGFLGTQMATNLSWQNFFLATGVTAICAAGASFTIINKEEFDKIKT